MIYAGTAIYKIAGSTNWPSSEIARQVQLTRDYRNIGSYGAIHYNYNNLKSNIKGIKDVLTGCYLINLILFILILHSSLYPYKQAQ